MGKYEFLVKINNEYRVIFESDLSKSCGNHSIEVKMIDGVKFRFCKKCGLLAHSDNNFSYICGSEYCRCMQ